MPVNVALVVAEVARQHHVGRRDQDAAVRALDLEAQRGARGDGAHLTEGGFGRHQRFALVGQGVELDVAGRHHDRRSRPHGLQRAFRHLNAAGFQRARQFGGQGRVRREAGELQEIGRAHV